MVSELRHSSHEVQIIKQLSQGPASHSGKKHIVQLLDRLEHEGSNDTHQCLVLESLGSSVMCEPPLYPNGRLPWQNCLRGFEADYTSTCLYSCQRYRIWGLVVVALLSMSVLLIF